MSDTLADWNNAEAVFNKARETRDELQRRTDQANRELEIFRRQAIDARDRHIAATAPPVDRYAVELTDGSPVPADGSHTADRGDGQQKAYIVLNATERAKGFVRPVRRSYRHVGKRPKYALRDLTESEREIYKSRGYAKYEEYPKDGSHGSALGRFWTEAELKSGCGQTTAMNRGLAETYARDPHFYSGTFCTTCHAHFDVGASGEFVWIEPDGSEGPRVGT